MEQKRKAKNQLICGVLLLAVFILYTLSLLWVDRQAIGPEGSVVAYAGINRSVHGLFGVHMTLYDITDWAGLVVILVAFGFAILGLVQLIKRKSLWKVDSSLLVLGVFYIVVFGTYVFLELNVVNYRPVLINGYLEASYPSSTTMLASCVMPTAMLQFSRLIQNGKVKKWLNLLCGLFTAFMVIGRLISGVHWFTDILGGLLFSGAVILLYCAANRMIDAKKESGNAETLS